MTDSTNYIQPTPHDHLLCVNISKTFYNKEREDIYDCARHYWRLSVNRAEKTEYVLAIVHGIVKAVLSLFAGIGQKHSSVSQSVMNLTV